MTESVSIKAYLKRDGQEVEVRRFGIDGGAATNYMYLRGKIQAMFPSVVNDQFSVFWQDSDKDYITIESDEELMVALTACTLQPVKLYIQVKTKQQPQGGSANQQTHAGVVCDGCDNHIAGYRYKCVTCPDYDLCSFCETSGQHSEHFMIRIPVPVGPHNHPKFFRKFFGRQSKFNKRHGWNRMREGLCGEPHGPLGSSHSPSFPHGGPPPPTTMMGDMFDFSSLLEFINSLTVPADNNANNEAPTRAQAPPSSQAPPGNTSSPQAQPGNTSSSQQPNPSSTTHPGPTQSGGHPADYLNGIGHAIAAFLDPFGVDVTFDVRAKSAGTTAQAPSAPTTSQQVPPQSTPSPNAEAPTVSPQTERSSAPVPPTVNEQPKEGSATPARRNSDDWTLLNRESPVRSEAVAMDVEENRGVKSKTPPPAMYPELPKETPSAPSQPENDRQREAIESIRSMGFNFEPTLLAELLRRQNGDIASVLEMILNNGKK